MKRRHPERPILIGIWLVAVFGMLQWRYPGFWVSPAEHFAEAERLAREGETDAALERVGRALRDLPEEPGYLAFRGYRLLELGRPEDAVEDFAHALVRAPGDPSAEFGLATALVASRTDLDSARAVLARLEETSTDAEDQAALARLYMALRQPGDALRAYSRALEARPDDTALLREMADAALALGRWERVVEFTDRWLAVASTEGERAAALSRRAPALRALGRPLEAYEAWSAIPDETNLAQRAALALEIERFDEAADLFRALRARGGTDPETERALAYSLQRAGHLTAADSVYRRLLQEPEVPVETRVRYAWLLNAAGRHDEAWRVLDPLPRPAADPALLALEARTAVWAGRDAEAIELLRRWLARPRPAHLLPPERAHEMLAALLDAAGRAEEALAEYRWLAAHRNDPASWEVVARLADRLGRAPDAEEAWERVRLAGGDEPEMWVRLAELRRGRDDPGAAAEAYSRYLAMRDDADAAFARVETLMEAGRPREALHAVRRLVDGGREDGRTLETAIWIAWAAEEPSEAARFYERLAVQRPLDAGERRQWADALRGAGEFGAALRLYERLATEGATELWEIVGDLRSGLGDAVGAVAAYAAVPPEARTPGLEARYARALMAAGRAEDGLAAYRRALGGGDASPELEVEYARAAAAAGRADTAVTHFLAAVGKRGAEGIRLDLARNLLAGQRFAEAERWAREAMQAGEFPDSARLALGESLQAQGRSEEAEKTLRPLVRSGPFTGAEEIVWQARVAAARDRHLEAWRLYGEAMGMPGVAGDPVRLAALWLARGRSALALEDYRRADEALDHATGGDVTVDGAHEARRAVASATVPRLEVPGSLFRDDNSLEFREARLGGILFPGRALRLNGELGVGRLEQGSAGFDRTAAGLWIDDWRPSPSLALRFDIGIEDYDEGGRIGVGGAAARFLSGDGSYTELRARRGTLWSAFRDRDPRRFNRVTDLAALGPDFRVLEGGFTIDRVIGGRDRRLRLDGRVADLEDGNLHGSFYGHLQIPLHRSLGPWTVLRPNLYVEFFDDRSPHYFSPPALVSLGLGLHGIRRGDRNRVEFEFQPEVRWAKDGGVDPGLFALGEATLGLGERVDLRFGTFGYLQGDGYWLIRPFLRATAAFGPRR